MKKLQPKTRSQLYVAITRARYSVGIVFDYDEKQKCVTDIERLYFNAAEI